MSQCGALFLHVLETWGAYVNLDNRLKGLILALKHWARSAGILRKQDGFLVQRLDSFEISYAFAGFQATEWKSWI